MNISIKVAIQKATEELRAAQTADPAREARSLLSRLLQRDQSFLIAHDDYLLNPDQIRAFDRYVARRVSGEPQQYITGHQEFYRLDFEVTPDVLIPRPETEDIVEAALAVLDGARAPLIADIGTGSGCIAVSLLNERTDARAVATDISAAALNVARRNARRLGVKNRLTFIESDVFDELSPETQFSLVAANPPYIPEEDWKNLPREVRDYEPRSALVSGKDGLDSVRRLLIDAPRFLCTFGFLIFEIGMDQEQQVTDLLDASTWQLIEMRRDLQGISRTVVLRAR